MSVGCAERIDRRTHHNAAGFWICRTALCCNSGRLCPDCLFCLFVHWAYTVGTLGYGIFLYRSCDCWPDRHWRFSVEFALMAFSGIERAGCLACVELRNLVAASIVLARAGWTGSAFWAGAAAAAWPGLAE